MVPSDSDGGKASRFTTPAQRNLLKIPRPDALRILHRLTELQRALDTNDTSALDIRAPRDTTPDGSCAVGDFRDTHRSL
jgi:mRNA interferase RelE/StbE